MQRQVLLFDLDGTLIDTALGFQCLTEQLAWKTEAFDNYARYYSGLSVRSYLEHLLIDKSNIDEKISDFLQQYHLNIEKYTFFFPGVLDILKDLTQRNITWGIVSNKDHAQCIKICQKFSLDPDFLLGAGVIPFKKPHPAPLLKAAQKLQVLPSQCFYFGDMPTDIQASEHALMMAVYCSYGCHHYIDPCYTYTRVCHKFEDLYEVCNIIPYPSGAGILG